MSDFLDELCKRVELAARNNTPLRPAGGSTKNFYGGPLQGEEVDMRQWAGIVEYEPTELVITVKPGTPLAEVEAALAAQKQELAFEPPRLGGAGHAAGGTIGGAIVSGLAGPARLSRGGVKDYVLGCTLLDGKGQLLQFGGVVMKNVAGYDVSRLLAGSWGTLGLITEVSLKVLPIAPAEAYLMCALPQAQALNLLHQWGGQPLPLNASCWVKDNTQAGAPEMLFVRLRGALAAVQAAKLRMSQDVAKLQSELIEQSAESAAQDWALCRDQALPFFTQHSANNDLALWRLSLPQTAPVLNLPNSASETFIEWHGAQRWIWAPLSEAQQIRNAAATVGGQATLFRRPQQASAAVNVNTPVFTPLDTVQQRIQHALKNEFDPAGIFSPRRLNAYF